MMALGIYLEKRWLCQCGAEHKEASQVMSPDTGMSRETLDDVARRQLPKGWAWRPRNGVHPSWSYWDLQCPMCAERDAAKERP